MAAAHFTLKASIDAGFSQVVMSKCGVAGKKFSFSLDDASILWLCAIVAIMGLTIYSKTGYESQNSRAQKDPSALKKAGLPKCTLDFVLTFPIYKLKTQTHNRDRECRVLSTIPGRQPSRSCVLCMLLKIWVSKLISSRT